MCPTIYLFYKCAVGKYYEHKKFFANVEVGLLAQDIKQLKVKRLL